LRSIFSIAEPIFLTFSDSLSSEMTEVLRKFRRTFGHRALNKGHDIHNVSIVIGRQTVPRRNDIAATRSNMSLRGK
jgi:hypothetical protein